MLTCPSQLGQAGQGARGIPAQPITGHVASGKSSDLPSLSLPSIAGAESQHPAHRAAGRARWAIQAGVMGVGDLRPCLPHQALHFLTQVPLFLDLELHEALADRPGQQ